jgi:hypothetical protein
MDVGDESRAARRDFDDETAPVRRVAAALRRAALQVVEHGDQHARIHDKGLA